MRQESLDHFMKQKLIIIGIVVAVLWVIGTVIDATDGTTSYEGVKQGDCYSDTFGSIGSDDLLISDFATVDCSQPHIGRVVYVESFEGREFPVSWEQYASDNCPATYTHFYHSVDVSVLYEEVFMCVVEGATDNSADA